MVTVARRLAVYRAGYIPSEPLHVAPDLVIPTTLVSIAVSPFVPSYTIGSETVVATSIVSIAIGPFNPGVTEGFATTEISVGFSPITPAVVIDDDAHATVLVGIGVMPITPNSNISQPIVVPTTLVAIAVVPQIPATTIASPCPINPCLLVTIRPQKSGVLPPRDPVNITVEVAIGISPFTVNVFPDPELSCTINPCLLLVFRGHVPVVLEEDDICVINPALLLTIRANKPRRIIPAFPYTTLISIGIEPISPTRNDLPCTINPCLLSVFVRSNIPPIAVIEIVATTIVVIGIQPLSPGAFFSGPRIDAVEIGIGPITPSFTLEDCVQAIWLLPERETEWLVPVHR